MRLWHKDLIPFLPKSQLLAQWRELNSIYKKQDKHLLINYNYTYSKEHLYTYSMLVISQMIWRGYKIKSYENMNNYFEQGVNTFSSAYYDTHRIDYNNIFIEHHDEDYLVKCFYNLKEKYDCGQNDFSEEQWRAIRNIFGKRVLAEVQRQLGGLK